MTSSRDSSSGSTSSEEVDATRVQMSETADERPPNREGQANCLSRLLFSYATSLILRGSKKVLEPEDLWPLLAQDDAGNTADDFEREYATERQKPVDGRCCCGRGQGFKNIIYRTNRARFWGVVFLSIIVGMAPVSSSIVLMYFIPWLANDEPYYWGFIYLAFFVVFPFLGSVAEAYAFRLMASIGVRARASANTAVFRKALRLTSEARARETTGKVLNLMSGDAEKLFQFSQFAIYMFTCPVQVVVCLILLFYNIGLSTFGGLIVLIILTPINGVIAAQFESAIAAKLKCADERTKLTNELLGGMKVVKLNCYEEPLLKRIAEVRAREVREIHRLRRATAAIWVVISITPTFIFLGAIAMYELMGNALTVQAIFVSFSLFEVLRIPLAFLPFLILSTVTTGQATSRIMEFLRNGDIADAADDKKLQIGSVIVKGSFAWAKVDTPAADQTKTVATPPSSDVQTTSRTASNSVSMSASTSSSATASGEGSRAAREITLSNIDLDVNPGSLTVIVGPVGSGKSSLISAVLRSIPAYGNTEATVRLRGSISYVPQTPWIINATIKDNILFGFPYEKRKYEETIRVCALQQDLETFPGGDQTEIGERGINLSGGQKQRISIARAVYADADIYLLDDSLSAVDAHVGKHIFEECFNGVLKGKTRILATNQLVVVPQADDIVFLSSGGEILEHGTYASLMGAGKRFAQFMEEFMGRHDENEAAPEEQAAKVAAEVKGDAAQAGGTLVEDEVAGKGRVSNAVYAMYIKALGGWGWFAAWLIMLLLTVGVRTVGSFALTYLSTGKLNGYLGVNWTIGQQFGLYAGINGLYFIFVCIQQSFYVPAVTRTSRHFFHALIQRVVRAPMSFFDTTPLGRVLNRFGRDMDLIDGDLGDQFLSFWNSVFEYFAILATIGISAPWFLIAIVPVTALYYLTQNFFRHSSLAMQRLNAISRSPIFAHFSETLDGVDSIRAYKIKKRFVNENVRRLNRNHEAYVTLEIANQWLKVRLGALSALTSLAAGLTVVLTRGTTDVGLSTLAVTNTFGVVGLLNALVTVAAQLERQLNSVERVDEYSRLPNEAPAVLPEDAERVPERWPTGGKIEFRDVVMSYREGLDPVLRKVKLSINAREKVGVVGRSGSGKSSLMVALFRLVELTEGAIVIDGIDSASIGLITLRRSMAIIPQDPVLFIGSIRENIDPFSEHSEDEIAHAVDVALLTETVAGLEGGLDTPVAEGGSNFSVGQRQLLCLARAVLKKPRILVMDEATASVDADTDAKIQRAVRTNFRNCTVLTIAHRLNTIMDADRILVMSDGKVAEFDSPANLIDIPKGHLATLVDKTGKASAALLRRMAHGEQIGSISIVPSATMSD